MSSVPCSDPLNFHCKSTVFPLILGMGRLLVRRRRQQFIQIFFSEIERDINLNLILGPRPTGWSGILNVNLFFFKL